MKVLARLRGGVDALLFLAIPLALVAIALNRAPDAEPLAGESRVGHHVRTCPNCEPDDSYADNASCPGLAVILEQIRAEAPIRAVEETSARSDPDSPRGRTGVARAGQGGVPFSFRFDGKRRGS